MRKLFMAGAFLAASFSRGAIAQTATTTTLAVTSAGGAATTVASGSVVTLAATVAGGAAVTTGQVSFCDAAASYCTDIHLLGTAQLTNAGNATLKFVPAEGSHSYKAVFLGTGRYGRSSSSASSLTVTGALHPSTTTIAPSGTAGNYTLTATVSGQGLVSPTGNVSFLDTGNADAVLATESLAGGQATVNWLNPQTPATGSNPYNFVVGDFNGDGIQDLVVLNYGPGYPAGGGKLYAGSHLHTHRFHRLCNSDGNDIDHGEQDHASPRVAGSVRDHLRRGAGLRAA